MGVEGAPGRSGQPKIGEVEAQLDVAPILVLLVRERHRLELGKPTGGPFLDRSVHGAGHAVMRRTVEWKQQKTSLGVPMVLGRGVVSKNGGLPAAGYRLPATGKNRE
jgi:hypothetical protein